MLILNPLKRRVRDLLGFPIFPGAFPAVGHLPAIASDYLGLVRRAEREVGPFFWLEAGFEANLTCTDPEVFSIFRNKVTTSTYLLDLLPDLFGISLIAQDGPVHQHMRSAMNAPFLPRGLTAAEVGPILADIIDRRVCAWRGRSEIKILAETRELVLAVMFRLLGVSETNLSIWREHYEEFMLLSINLPFELPGFPKPRGRRARAWLNEQLLEIIRRAREEPQSSGILPAIVAGRDDGGAGLSDDELVDNLRLLVLAGHETSASTMAWMVIMMAQRPDVWEAVCAEAVAAGSIPQSPKELRSFPYAEAVFRETLRLHPPVASDTRRALVDFELAGRTVPAGRNVTVSIMHLSRHPATYEHPDEFVPERWLGRSEGVSALELVQFGGGPHFCLGYHLAWMEIVQFAVALALAMRGRGLSPKLAGAPPKMRYLPLLHPSANTRVAFA